MSDYVTNISENCRHNFFKNKQVTKRVFTGLCSLQTWITKQHCKVGGPKFKWNILSFISKLNAWTLLMYYCTVMCWWFSCDWERSDILPALTFANVNVGKHWSHNILYDTSKVCHLVFRLICCWGGVHVVSWKGQMGDSWRIVLQLVREMLKVK